MLAKGMSITTVGIYVQALRVIYNRAIDDGFISNDKYPFGLKVKRKYEIPTGNNIKKALEIDAIQKIIGYKPTKDKAEFSRDIWMFCFYCNGMNIGDASILKNHAVPVAQISENLGHSSITTTENYLNSFPNQSIKDTAEYLEFLVGDKKGKEQ